MTDHDLSLEISTLRDLVTRIERGTFDGCHPELLKHLHELADELQAAVAIIRVVAPLSN